MEEVGNYLRKEANNSNKNTHERDLFARSAYNRYYYACYLHLNSEVSGMNQNWGFKKHGDIHKKLTLIKRYINNESNRYINNESNNSNDEILRNRVEIASKALDRISEIFHIAYDVRVVADYYPEISVKFLENNQFSLPKNKTSLYDQLDISDAHEWYAEVRSLIREVKMTWKHIQ